VHACVRARVCLCMCVVCAYTFVKACVQVGSHVCAHVCIATLSSVQCSAYVCVCACVHMFVHVHGVRVCICECLCTGELMHSCVRLHCYIAPARTRTLS